jgi:hypothetical protein
MSFYNDNKYYIRQNLQIEMKTLSIEERQSKYNCIKKDIRERIHKSYPKNGTNKNEPSNIELNLFYKELFEIIGEFDLEYIITNLFFETYFPNIVHYLVHNTDVLKRLVVAPFEQYTFKQFLRLYSQENDFFNFVFIKFLKEFICSHTSLSLRHLEIQTINNAFVFEFVHEYPKWLIDNLTKPSNIDATIFIHLLVVKLLNLEPNFIKHEKGSSFAILLLNGLSQAYNLKIIEGVSPKLNLFYTQTNNLIDTLFTKKNIIKTPLFDSDERSSYTRGVYIKRKEFLKQVEEAEILNNDNKDESYLFLFQMFIQSNSKTIQNKIKEDILNKIKLFELPTDDELKDLNKIDLPNDLAYFKKWFLSKFYLYQLT